MSKRTGRTAWGLAAILAVVVVLAGVTLAAGYQRRLPERKRYLTVLPRGEWGFGGYSYSLVAGNKVVYHEEWQRFGFFKLRVK
jgi:hypothetical protein